MKKYALILLLFSSALLISCAPKQKDFEAGMKVGKIIPQALGHEVEALLADDGDDDTVLGLLLFTKMDKYDRQQLNHVYERGTSDKNSFWTNPGSVVLFQVRPQPAYGNPATRQPCRQAEIIFTIAGKDTKISTNGCRNMEGHWLLEEL